LNTGKAALAGLGMSLAAGTLIALAFAEFPLVRRACYPYAIFLQTVPIVAIAPLIILWCGNGFWGVTATVFIISLFPMVANGTAGLIGADPRLLELFAVNNASRWQTLLKLRFPGAIPRFAEGLKISAGLSVIGAIVGEFVAGFGSEGGRAGAAHRRRERPTQDSGVVRGGLCVHPCWGLPFSPRSAGSTRRCWLAGGAPSKGSDPMFSTRCFRVSALGLFFAAWMAAGCGQEASKTATASAGGASGSEKKPLQKVKLLLNWFPEAEHGGFYAAQTEGYFAKEGLEVEIVPGGPEVPVLPRVSAGQAEFGVCNADEVIMARGQGHPVVALMASLQNSPRCIMVHANSGIDSFEKLNNVTLAMSAGAPFSEFLHKNYELENVQIVPYPGNVTRFLLEKNFAQQGYVFSEPIVAKLQGGDPKALMVSDAGFNPYTSVLAATETTIRERGELVGKMVRASAQGWERYLQAPEAANKVILEKNPEMDAQILALGAEALQPLALDAFAREHGVGGDVARALGEADQATCELGDRRAKRRQPERSFRAGLSPEEEIKAPAGAA
jgi:NitT/TauT family transport system substrate-binding protein